MADEVNRKLCESIVCKSLKQGSLFPDSDRVIAMIDDLQGKDHRNQSYSDKEEQVCKAVMTGLMYLAQLCIAKERM